MNIGQVQGSKSSPLIACSQLGLGFSWVARVLDSRQPGCNPRPPGAAIQRTGGQSDEGAASSVSLQEKQGARKDKSFLPSLTLCISGQSSHSWMAEKVTEATGWHR
ncbi:Uncharacterized protein HZ326_25647 [Fusarium oxysporum f. sp. albedinis]|nr:Uncharacterized protein HZ326_25647 [Fusarium oxysporum f. sp. albedinis]